jgi:hypothetical protein
MSALTRVDPREFAHAWLCKQERCQSGYYALKTFGRELVVLEREILLEVGDQEKSNSNSKYVSASLSPELSTSLTESPEKNGWMNSL